MKKRKKYQKPIITTIIIIFVLLASLNLNRQYLKPEVILKDLLLKANKLLITTTYSKTIDQTESYLIQKNLNTSLENEIKELKELLNLNSTHSTFDKVHATVISRNNIYWLNTLTIDKGTNDGIKKDMAVITTNGLIGKISKTTKTTSEVKLLTSDDITYKTSVVIRVDNKDYYAILNGYNEETNLLKVTAIDKNIPSKTGAAILTSGLGNMPQGIYIGSVVSSNIDSYDLSKTVYVKSNQDFSTINYVTILKEKI